MLLQILRWIGVLPAAFAGFALAYPVGGLLVQGAASLGLVNPPSDMSFSNRCERYLLWYLPMTVAFLCAGSFMAPRARTFVACVLSALWVCWAGAIHRWSPETLLAGSLSAACGIVAVAASSRKLLGDGHGTDQRPAGSTPARTPIGK
jgi:hypothetical protein